MEESTGSLGVHQPATTVQRSSSNQSGTPSSSQGGGSAIRPRTRIGTGVNHRASIHALAMQTTGVALRPGTGAYVTVPQIAGSASGDWYEVGSVRSGHYSGGASGSIGNPSISTRRRMVLPGPSNYPRPKSNWSKFKDAFRSFVAWVFSNVGICVLVVGYLIIGAIAFKLIEGPEEVKTTYRVGAYRKDIVQKLWEITNRYNVLEFEKWKSESEEVVKEFQTHIVNQTKSGYEGKDGHPKQWTFSGSLLYSITVITTIGYGHIAPSTSIGKLVTIFYTVIGIPLFLLYLSNIGDIMATSFKWTYSRVCKCQGRKKAKAKGSNGDNAGSSAEIKSVLKRTQTFRVNPSVSSQIHSTDVSVNPPGKEDQIPTPSGEGTPTVASAVVPTPDESGSSTTATTIGGTTAKRGSASITARGGIHGGQPDTDMVSVYSEYLEDPDILLSPQELGAKGRRVNINAKPINSLDKVTVPISLVLTVMVGYICGGAILFGQWEGWSFLDGSYFCFITLSTIGFGDIVPGENITEEVPEEEGVLGLGGGVNPQFILCSLYILIGMAVIAMCFNLMQQKVIEGVRNFGKKIGIIKDESNENIASAAASGGKGR